MATNIKLTPQANQNLLSGKLQGYLSDTANYFVANNPPSSSKLPCYLWIDYGSTKQELVKVYDVAGNNVYIKRGLNNGGIGFTHDDGASYKEAITTYHWDAVTKLLEEGYVVEQTDVYTFTKLSATQFKIAGVDRTNYYTANNVIRFNGSIVTQVVSSSFSSPDTIVTVSDSVVPDTISMVEIKKFVSTDFFAEHSPTGAHTTNVISEKTAGAGVTVDGVLLQDGLITLPKQSTSPPTPSTNKSVVYVKTDGYLYYKDDAGVERRYYPPTVDNNVSYQAKDSGGTARSVAKVNTSGVLEIGDSNLGLSLKNKYMASAYNSANYQHTTNPSKARFDTENFDFNNNFDTTNWRYTAPINGWYLVFWNIQIQTYDSTASYWATGSMLYKNGSESNIVGTFDHGIYPNANAKFVVTTSSRIVLINLNAGDYLEIYAYSDDYTGLQAAGGQFTIIYLFS